MKKIRLSLFGISLVAAMVIFSACSKKDDPSPSSSSSNVSSFHFTGDTEGSVTIDGTTTAVSGKSTNSTYGLILTPRNMTPVNSYPAFDISFGTMPTKDSTYNINTNNFASISVDDNNTFYDEYFALTGSIVVDVSSDSFTATVNNLTVQNQASQTKVVSGYIKYYK
jgi:hypothetical protein